MLQIKDTIQSVKGVILGLIVVLGISVASAGTYVGPTSAPTGGNPDAPINVGSSIQAKQGSLSVFAFTATLNAYFAQNVGIGDSSNDGTLKLDVEGDIGATRYCDQNGANCVSSGDLGGGGGDGTGTPAGAVMAFDATSCPAGWSEYTAAQGKNIIGANTTYPKGTTGGSATHVLTDAQMPKHDHPATVTKDMTAGVNSGTTCPAGTVYGVNCTKYSYGDGDERFFQFNSGKGIVNVGNAGADQAHPIMDPYVALLYCKKS